MQVAVHSLEKTLYAGEAEKLICKTPQGQITVLDRHIPLVTLLAGPKVEVVGRAGERTAIPVSGGFMEVQPESNVIILAAE